MSECKLFSMNELIAILSLSRATINRLRAEKMFPLAVYPTGRKVPRWKAQDIAEWINSLERESVKEEQVGNYDPFNY